VIDPSVHGPAELQGTVGPRDDDDVLEEVLERLPSRGERGEVSLEVAARRLRPIEAPQPERRLEILDLGACCRDSDAERDNAVRAWMNEADVGERREIIVDGDRARGCRRDEIDGHVRLLSRSDHDVLACAVLGQ